MDRLTGMTTFVAVIETLLDDFMKATTWSKRAAWSAEKGRSHEWGDYPIHAFGWIALLVSTADAAPAYFTKYSSLSMTRNADGILTVTMTNGGKPICFNARDHEMFVD